MPPVAPMLAKSAPAVRREEGWWHEPKWDGFRALVFRDGDDVVIGSRGGKDLARYFPELVDAFRAELPRRCVLDGEIAVAVELGGRRRLSWETLAQRIHPADSRVRLLAEQTPAIFIGFDALSDGASDLTGEPFRVRREALVAAISGSGTCRMTRLTDDPDVAAEWFSRFEGAGLDGVVSKRADGPYLPGKRDMLKLKHARSADCVVIGYRVHKSGSGIGSALLGLHTDDGDLMMVGGIVAFPMATRVELQERFEGMRLNPDGVEAGEVSRWKTSGSAQWIAIRPELVVEVAFDQMEGPRFRHAVSFVRWRPDREPESCRFDQLEVPIDFDLDDVLDGAGGIGRSGMGH